MDIFFKFRALGSRPLVERPSAKSGDSSLLKLKLSGTSDSGWRKRIGQFHLLSDYMHSSHKALYKTGRKKLWFVLSVRYSVGLKFISRSFLIYFIAICQFHVHGASIHTRNNIATTESIREPVKVAGEVGQLPLLSDYGSA